MPDVAAAVLLPPGNLAIQHGQELGKEPFH